MKRLLSLFLLTLPLFSTPLPPESAPVSQNSRIFVGAEAYYYHLQIEDGSTVSSVSATPHAFTGTVAGFILGYEYKKPESLYAVLQASYALGSIKTRATGNNRRFIHDEILETRWGYNASFLSENRLTFTPYTGAGIRWNIQYRNPGTLPGLKFNYYKIYIPLGFLLNYKPHPAINLGLDFEWMPDVLSMVSLSSLGGSFWELQRMNNYLVQVPCTFSFAKRYEVSLTPFWMQFVDGKSVAVTDAGIALGLQKQVTNDWGGRLSMGVHF